jgi:hypothetical protein
MCNPLMIIDKFLSPIPDANHFLVESSTSPASLSDTFDDNAVCEHIVSTIALDSEGLHNAEMTKTDVKIPIFRCLTTG